MDQSPTTSQGQGLAELDESFDSGQLDRSVWVPNHAAHWSSRAATEATWSIRDDALHLTIPPEQPLWCPDLHEEPLKVSCIQSASYSGPAGSPDGPQPFRDGLVVREVQPTLWGYIPTGGCLGVTMRANVDQASMFAFYLSGIEDRPERSGEICVAEIFGSSVRDGRTEVGMGIKAFRDPALTEAFTTVELELDITVDHDYTVVWTGDNVLFRIDGRVLHEVHQSPNYPMQLQIGVFDFPRQRPSGAVGFVPELIVSRVWGRPAQR